MAAAAMPSSNSFGSIRCPDVLPGSEAERLVEDITVSSAGLSNSLRDENALATDVICRHGDKSITSSGASDSRYR